MLVDSTGLKLCGAGEWLVEKHGTRMRRFWQKLHIGLDGETGQIVAASLTAKEVDDGAEPSRMGWQKRSGYAKRDLAAAAIGRWKQVIGDGLRARTDERRATEVDVAVHTLNRMLDLGRPKYVRIA